jgi:hypothetical protein
VQLSTLPGKTTLPCEHPSPPLQEKVLPRPKDLFKTSGFSTAHVLLVRATVSDAVSKFFTTYFGESEGKASISTEAPPGAGRLGRHGDDDGDDEGDDGDDDGV